MEIDNITCKLKYEYPQKLNLNPRQFEEVLNRISREVFPNKELNQDTEEFIRFRISRWICNGIQIKLQQHRVPPLPNRVNITYQSENRFMNESYPENVKSALFRTSDFRFVEDLYNTFDDLKYAIYRATEIAKFICSYDTSLDIQNMIQHYENVREESDIYRDIETYPRDIPGLQIFKDNLISQSTFLKRPLDKFPDVISELEKPINIWANAYNTTFGTRKKNIEDLLKIETFKQYSIFIRNQIRENLLKNVDECVRMYGSVDNALNTMGEQLNRFINNFYIPQNRDDAEFKKIEEVYDLCEMNLGPAIMSDLSFLLLKSNLLLKTQNTQKIPLQNYRIGIDPKRISNKDITKIVITKDKVNVDGFKILAPSDRSAPFRDDNGRLFQSVSDYAGFNIIKEFFGLSDEAALGSFDSFDKILNNVLCSKTVEVVNTFLDGHMEVLKSLPANTHLILPNFIGDIVGNYLTNLKNQGEIVVRNREIINWCERRADDMYNTLSLFDSGLNPVNILNTIYCYDTLNIPIVINSDYRTNPKYEDIFPYISGFIASIISSGYSEANILEMTRAGSRTLSSHVIVKSEILELIDVMIWIIRSRISNNDNDTPYTEEEKHRVICILLNQKLNKIRNLTNEKISSIFQKSLYSANKDLNIGVLSRLNFFKDTMENLTSYNFDAFFKPRTDKPTVLSTGSPAGPDSPYYDPQSPPYGTPSPDYLSHIQPNLDDPETPDYSVHFNFKDVDFVYSKPKKLTKCQLDSIFNLVSKGNQVPISSLETGLMNAKTIGYAIADGELASVGVLKKPNESYKQKVFTQAGIQELAENYPYEYGYAFTKDEERFRRKGLSSTLLEGLLRDSEKVYATVRVDNFNSRGLLEKHGFVPSGNPYDNATKEYKLMIYLKN
jgi:hypothetical protein